VASTLETREICRDCFEEGILFPTKYGDFVCWDCRKKHGYFECIGCKDICNDDEQHRTEQGLLCDDCVVECQMRECAICGYWTDDGDYVWKYHGHVCGYCIREERLEKEAGWI
jgi:hypothetical protein